MENHENSGELTAASDESSFVSNAGKSALKNRFVWQTNESNQRKLRVEFSIFLILISLTPQNKEFE
jgi:hypothetical protein